MIQAVRFYLPAGCSGTYQIASRAKVYHSFQGQNGEGSYGGSALTWDLNYIFDSNIDDQFSQVMQTTTAGNNANNAVKRPWFAQDLGKWVYSYFDSDLDKLYGLSEYNVIDQIPTLEQTNTMALLDPMQEPTWTKSADLFSGDQIITFQNAKTVEVAITLAPENCIYESATTDSGRFGWLSAGHGALGIPNNQLDWGPLQFLNFLRNRVHLNAGM